MKNHLSVGVYLNDTFVVNVVKDEHLSSHKEYNKIFRPGRLLFVDGKYFCGGEHLDKVALNEMICVWESKICDLKVDINKPSEKYV